MKTLLTIGALVLAMMPLTACRSLIPGGPENSMEAYRRAVDSWRGAGIDQLLAAWPRSWVKDQTDLEDGSSVYAFIRTLDHFRQAEQYYDHANNEWVTARQGGKVLLICETRFAVDVGGIITEVRPGSSHCGEMAPPPGRD